MVVKQSIMQFGIKPLFMSKSAPQRYSGGQGQVLHSSHVTNFNSEGGEKKNKKKFALKDFLHSMSENHHQTRLHDHDISHVLVLTGHHHHSLLPWDPFSYIVLVQPAVHLASL